jgi:diguanylate cyclase (GGDEF)-like protein
MVMRWGGEEFLIVLPNTAVAGAMSAAERLRSAVAATEVASSEGASIRFTISVGIASAEGEGASELLTRSDAQVYGKDEWTQQGGTICASPGQGWSQGESEA